MSSVEKLKELKELMDAGVISKEEFEEQKKKILFEDNQNDKKEKRKLIVQISVIAIICIAIISSFIPSDENAEKAQTSTETSRLIEENNESQNIPKSFQSECPISVSASIADNIIGVPELGCNIKNNTDKEILAVQLYFVPKNVYGEDINSILTTNRLYTDNAIAANGSTSRSWQLLDSEVKSGEIYIYSVYFSDGTEWGNKDAKTTEIKKYGKKVIAEY